MTTGKHGEMVMDAAEKRAIYTIIERKDGKSNWVRVGIGYVNRDGSITVKLDALPVNGVLQVREWEDPGMRALEARKRAEQSAAQHAVA
jgi:hypothetical protein